jgi:hypothetical protein
MKRTGVMNKRGNGAVLFEIGKLVNFDVLGLGQGGVRLKGDGKLWRIKGINFEMRTGIGKNRRENNKVKSGEN